MLSGTSCFAGDPCCCGCCARAAKPNKNAIASTAKLAGNPLLLIVPDQRRLRIFPVILINFLQACSQIR